MWLYPWTHVGTPSHLGHMDRVAPQAHAGAAQEAPDIGQWEEQDIPLVRPSSCNVKGGIPSSRRYLPTSTPAPPPRRYPFPWGLPPPSAPSVPASHPILVPWCPVWGGGWGCICGLDCRPARGLAWPLVSYQP